ncbi:hypothetical protein [Haliangium sp.]|uniref:leucine-rich repeat domain-containing protein n=1 Tax=Haliangium sp. TaxID=2663208 RepID=UPI003D11F139
MKEALRVHTEECLRWDELARYRPESGLAFEKHRWLFPLRKSAAPGEAELFERAGSVVLRDRYLRLDDGRELPAAALVDAAAMPTLARVVLAGTDADALVAALARGDALGLHGPDSQRRLATDSATPGESIQLGTYRVPAAKADELCTLLSAEPRLYLLANPVVPMSMQLLRSLRTLSGGAATGQTLSFARFAELVAATRWLATSLGTTHAPMPGIVIYGGPELIPAVRHAAAVADVTVRWLDEGDAVDGSDRLRTSEVVLTAGEHEALPGWSALPTDDGNRLDLGGYNLAHLPARAEAAELVLDGTAVVDLAPLGDWPNLVSLSMRGPRPISFEPLTKLRSLSLGYTSPDRLPQLSRLHGLDSLRLDGAPLDRLAPLAGCTELRSLELRHTSLSTLEGLGALPALERLSIEMSSAPAALERLAELPRLRELSLHVAGRLDAAELPELPALKRLSICGLDGQPLALDNVDTLARYRSLESLALRATDVRDLAWLPALAHLTALDLAATDVEDLTPLRGLARLRELSLHLVPASEITPIAELSALEILDASAVETFTPDVLTHLPRLRALRLADSPISSIAELPCLPEIDALTLAHTGVTSLDGLERLPCLSLLDLAGTGVEDIAGLGEQASLRTLRLVGCPVSDIGPIGRLSGLVDLDLSSTRVSDVAPLAGCVALERLGLARLSLSDLAPIAALPNLRALDLHGAQFSDPAPLGSVSRLRTLDITGSTLDSLTPLIELRHLRELRAGYLPCGVDASPALSLSPLALLTLSPSILDSAIQTRLAARHHLVLIGE